MSTWDFSDGEIVGLRDHLVKIGVPSQEATEVLGRLAEANREAYLAAYSESMRDDPAWENPVPPGPVDFNVPALPPAILGPAEQPHYPHYLNGARCDFSLADWTRLLLGNCNGHERAHDREILLGWVNTPRANRPLHPTKGHPKRLPLKRVRIECLYGHQHAFRLPHSIRHAEAFGNAIRFWFGGAEGFFIDYECHTRSRRDPREGYTVWESGAGPGGCAAQHARVKTLGEAARIVEDIIQAAGLLADQNAREVIIHSKLRPDDPVA